MNKFDLVEKIRFFDLISALLKKSNRSPCQLLKEEINLGENWQENYFNWGRSALYYFFKSLKFKTITFPAFTCPTIVEPAEKAGKKVILTEIDLDTFNLNINKIPKNTECLVVVHTFGNPVDIKALRQAFGPSLGRGAQGKIFVIEDCAHALFSKINNRFVASQGDAILFSLYKQVPNINGSLLLTRDIITEVARLSNPRGWMIWQPRSDFNYLKRLIFKVQGPHQLLLSFKRQTYLPKIEPQELNSGKPGNLVYSLFEKGFKKLEKEVEKRREIVNWYYQQAEKSKFIISQKPEPGSKPSYYHFAVRLKPELTAIREKIVLELRKKNIFIDRLWYKAPIVQVKYKKEQKNCPNALLLARTVINLPIYSFYRERDIKYLFRQLNGVINRLKPKTKGQK